MGGFDMKYMLEVLPVIGKALPITLGISVISMILGLLLGLVVTMMRRSQGIGLKEVMNIYVSFFRGTPLMVQIFIFFFGLPQIIPSLSRVNAFQAAVIILSINASAYISEVLKGTIEAVDKGQYEAALSLGMSRFQMMERIILPQAFKIAVRPLGNTFISLVQGTAITFMIGLKDIMGMAKVSSAASYRFLEAFLAVGLIYWFMTLMIGKLVDLMDQRLSKGGLV